jgi:hypothetical protein
MTVCCWCRIDKADVKPRFAGNLKSKPMCDQCYSKKEPIIHSITKVKPIIKYLPKEK